MRDGPGRRAIKAAVRAAWAVEFGLRRVFRHSSRPPFRLAGECRRSGGCCERPTVQVGAAVWYLPRLRRWLIRWHWLVNRFELVGRDGELRLLIFRCHHFDPSSRCCDSYGSRPTMCRQYPAALLDQPHPQFLPGCGFRPVAWNAAALRKALAATDLDEAARRKLEEELFLVE